MKKQLEEARILVLGDIMLDRYVRGDVNRISPEAPVPVVRVTRERNLLGGAANVAMNISSLGANAILIGYLGNDNDINIKTDKPEFLEWKWIDLDLITEVVVDFKLHVYKELKEKVKKIIN